MMDGSSLQVTSGLQQFKPGDWISPWIMFNAIIMEMFTTRQQKNIPAH